MDLAAWRMCVCVCVCGYLDARLVSVACVCVCVDFSVVLCVCVVTMCAFVCSCVVVCVNTKQVWGILWYVCVCVCVCVRACVYPWLSVPLLCAWIHGCLHVFLLFFLCSCIIRVYVYVHVSLCVCLCASSYMRPPCLRYPDSQCIEQSVSVSLYIQNVSMHMHAPVSASHKLAYTEDHWLTTNIETWTAQYCDIVTWSHLGHCDSDNNCVTESDNTLYWLMALTLSVTQTMTQSRTQAGWNPQW